MRSLHADAAPRTRGWRWRHPALLVLCGCLVGCSAQGCGGNSLPTSKLDAEELGYQEEFDGVLRGASSSAWQLWNSTQDVKKFTEAGEKQQADGSRQQIANTFQALKKQGVESLERLRRTLPPGAMATVHHKLIAYLESAAKARDADALLDESLAFHKAYKALRDELDARKPQPESAEPLNLVLKFNIEGIPVSWNLRTGDFVIETPLKLPGSQFLPGHKQGGGTNAVTKFIVRANGKDRYFSMKRDFELFVPAEYGVHVKKEKETLVLEVAIKPGEKVVADSGKKPPEPPVQTVPETPVEKPRDPSPQKPADPPTTPVKPIDTPVQKPETPVTPPVRTVDVRISAKLENLKLGTANLLANEEVMVVTFEGQPPGRLAVRKGTGSTAEGLVKVPEGTCRYTIQATARVTNFAAKSNSEVMGTGTGSIEAAAGKQFHIVRDTSSGSYRLSLQESR
jgi:hypothetical protein